MDAKIRNNIRDAFYSRWGRLPTEEQIDEIIRQDVERRQPKTPKTPSLAEQLIYGIGGQGIANLAGAYTQSLGQDIAKEGFYDALFGSDAVVPEVGATGVDTGNFFARLYDDSMVQNAVQSAYEDSLVQDLVMSIFG